jgi:hypothetical protein
LLRRSVFKVEKKLSIAALSQQLPRLLMLQTMPCAASSRWKSSLVYCDPWSEWCRTARGRPRLKTAISKASITNCAVIVGCIDQPTTRRENKSSTTATKSQP